jgi:hypothetical protein
MRFLDLRKILFIDALTCVACGALMAGASGPLATLTQIPAVLLLYAGLSLFPIAGFMALVGTRAIANAPAVWLAVAGNALWILASVWLLFSGSITPNPLGKTFIAFQASVVLVLTVLETEALVARLPKRVRAA